MIFVPFAAPKLRRCSVIVHGRLELVARSAHANRRLETKLGDWNRLLAALVAKHTTAIVAVFFGAPAEKAKLESALHAKFHSRVGHPATIKSTQKNKRFNQ